MSSPFIPAADPRANYLARRAEIDAAMTRVLEEGIYVLGEEVARFEREFADWIGAGHAVGTGSGTDALHLALRALGLRPGDEVITASHTAVATVAAIELSGAVPVLADVDPDTLTLDPGRLDAALSPRTKAIIAVHLYGHPADLEALTAFAGDHGLALIEDCAQSAGASLKGRRTGTWGRLAAFSFYPTKNLGALGDGGAVVTDDAELARQLRSLREYGWRERYVSDVPGMNSRLDELQAAVLRVKLRHLDAENRRRGEMAGLYRNRWRETPLVLPAHRPDVVHAYHQFVVRHPRRDLLREHLRRDGIGTLIHYPQPVHLQPAYRGRVRTAGPLPRSEEAANSVLSLPLYPELSAEQVERVARSVLSWKP